MFGFLGKKARSEVGKVGGFGKIAGLGDFVRTPSPSDEMMAFEAWLTRAMETAEARGIGFKEKFVAGGPFGFLWAGAIDKKQRGLLAGVIHPSVDAVGRRFPIVIGAPMPLAAFQGQPQTAPLVLAEFFAAAATAAARATRTRSQAEFFAEIFALAPPSIDTAASSTYDAWSKRQRATDLWSQLFGAEAAHASKWALYMLVEAVKPYRGQELPPQPLGMRVPLGADRGITTAMWIDLVRSAAGWKTTVPSMFVPLDGASSNALIQLGAEVPANVLCDLYTPSDDSETVCDAAPTADSKIPSMFPPAVDRATASDDAMLSDVAAALAT